MNSQIEQEDFIAKGGDSVDFNLYGLRIRKGTQFDYDLYEFFRLAQSGLFLQ